MKLVIESSQLVAGLIGLELQSQLSLAGPRLVSNSSVAALKVASNLGPQTGPKLVIQD